MEKLVFAFDAFGGPITPRRAPVPAPRGREVLLAVSHCGVCHTDLHVHEGHYDVGGGRRVHFRDRGVEPPVTLGHEIVGTVAAAGPQADGVEPGRRYLVFPWIGCGACAACAAGDENLCAAPRFLGVFAPGGYQTHLTVPDPRYLIDIEGLDPALAATFACSGLTAFGAVSKLGRPSPDAWVAVSGCGGLGQMALALLAARGIERRIALDPAAEKRARAEAAGAVAVDPSAPDAADQIARIAGGGLAGVLDFVGNEASTALALASLAKGGTLVVVGLYGGELRYPLPFIPVRAITIAGSYVGRLDELRAFVAFARTIDLDALPVEVRPMEAAGAALSDLSAGRVAGRLVLSNPPGDRP